MAKQWIQITKERVARLHDQVQDANLLKLAVRPELNPWAAPVELSGPRDYSSGLAGGNPHAQEA
jgi:hypothetical protein